MQATHTRLNAADVAAQLDLSWSELVRLLAAAGHVTSKSTLHRALAHNQWPARADTQALRDALAAALELRGATAQQLATLFEPAAPAARPTTRQRQAARAIPTHPATQETEVLLPAQSLSQAARKAFQMFTNPFDNFTHLDGPLFTSDEIAFVRESCWQAAIGSRFVALVGESGAGKTTIVQDLEERIQRDRKPVKVIRPSVLGMEDTDTKGKTLKSADILAAVITTLDPMATVPQTLEARSLKMTRLLTASAEAGFGHLLVIEEAHCLPDATLKHLKRLHERTLGRRPLLGILLVAQPELRAKLDPTRASLREVTQRCEIVELYPLGSELRRYLQHRLQAANLPTKVEQLFTDDALEAIRARLTVASTSSSGKTSARSLLYPLAVNNMATAALNTAAELGVPVINRDVVRAI